MVLHGPFGYVQCFRNLTIGISACHQPKNFRLAIREGFLRVWLRSPRGWIQFADEPDRECRIEQSFCWRLGSAKDPCCGRMVKKAWSSEWRNCEQHAHVKTTIPIECLLQDTTSLYTVYAPPIESCTGKQEFGDLAFCRFRRLKKLRRCSHAGNRGKGACRACRLLLAFGRLPGHL